MSTKADGADGFEDHATRGNPLQRYGASVVSVFVGLLLIGLSIPQISAYGRIASWSKLVPDALDSGSVISSKILGDAQADYCRAAEMLPSDAHLTQDCSRLTLRLVEAAGQTASAKSSLVFARDKALSSVIAAPNRSFAWGLLGGIEDSLETSPDRVIRQINMASLTGPYMPSSMLLRVPVALRHWDMLPQDFKASIARDMRVMWLTYELKENVIQLYLRAGFAERSIIRKNMLASDAETKRFDNLIRGAAFGSPR